ncbi:hypothetical protein BDR26DRAFT_901692 [Obelidium mucronatum]|nr:hypothetical protein BDR26DRAFT_901692 [Obelidium mucronatum]
MNPEEPVQAPVLYETHLAFRICEFSSQTSPPLLAPITIYSSSMLDFTNKLYMAVRPHLKKKALVDMSTNPFTFSWDPRGENIDVSMLADYIQFHDTIAKKKLPLSAITPDTLVTWRTKFPSTNPVVLIVSMNSNTISSGTIQKEFVKALGSRTAVDRAGADTEQALNEMIRRLREHYQSVYTSAHVNWRIWASILLQGDVQNLEERFLQGPDASIIHLFATAGVAHEYQNRQILLSNHVAIQENQRNGTRLEALRFTMNQIVTLIKDLDAQLAAAEVENSQQYTVLVDMQNALRPVEPQAARGIYHQITNQMDIDHAPNFGNLGGGVNSMNNGQ